MAEPEADADPSLLYAHGLGYGLGYGKLIFFLS